MEQVPAIIVRPSSTLGRATRWPGPTQKLARMPQISFGLGTDASHELPGGSNVGDQVHPLPGPDHRPFEIPVPNGGSEPRVFLIQRRAEVILPSLPAFHKRISYGATGVRLRPRMLAHNVEDPSSPGVAALG